MDYLEHVNLVRHMNWQKFTNATPNNRKILLTTKSSESYFDFKFQAEDILLLGSESAGVPEHVHEQADNRITVPMRADHRSLNLATAAAMVLGEALRQLDAFPKG